MVVWWLGLGLLAAERSGCPGSFLEGSRLVVVEGGGSDGVVVEFTGLFEKKMSVAVQFHGRICFGLFHPTNEDSW